jgi:PBSX family phage terminase large subunit
LQSQKLQSEWTVPYVPHSKQEPFHSDRYRYKFRLISGGTGSGKTVAGVWEMLSYLLDDNPGAVGYIFEPTYRLVRRILIPTLERLLGYPIESNFVVQNYSKTDNRIDFRNGSKLWFGGLEDPEMAEGPNIDVIQVDEARLVRHFDVAWRVVQRRIRGSVPGKYPTGAYVTTTPNAPKSFLHGFFEDPKQRDPESHVYRMSIYDNPHLTQDYIKGVERGHTGGRGERFLYGRFAAVGGGIIPFDSTVHELTSIIHTMLKEVIYGVDFGYTNPACILAVGFDGDGRAYVLEEFYEKEMSHDQLVTEAKDMCSRHGRGRFYCDRSEPETIEMFNSHGLRAEGSKAKRDEGIREMAGRFAVAGDGRPRIYILSECVNLIAELMEYDPKVKEYDHAVDALRYALASKMKRRITGKTWSFGPELSLSNLRFNPGGGRF